MKLEIRKTLPADVPRVNEIYDQAKAFLAGQGLDQWQNGYPNAESARADVDAGTGYVLLADGEVVGTAALCFAEDPTYKKIYEGGWRRESYAAIHRVAVDARHRGAGLAPALLGMLEPLCRSAPVQSIRIDTHRHNQPMQRMLRKCGFEYRGIIYLLDGSERFAFDKLLD